MAVSVGSIAIAALASTSAAQAHEPWIAKAWGFNGQGQLGDGTTEGPEKCEGAATIALEACSASPVEVSKLSGVKAVAGGAQNGSGFALALLDNGTVMSWGVNSAGQLGNGTKASSDVPVAVCGPAPEPCPGSHLSGVTGVAAGTNFAIALLEDGKVMAWGSGEGGRLGNGTTTGSNVPVEVTGLAEAVTAVAAGGGHSLALLSGGKLVAWGDDNWGTLGDGGKASNVPVSVCAVGTTGECPTGPVLENVTAIATTGSLSMALLSSGKVADWGIDKQGNVGDGTEAPEVDDPVEVSGLSGVTTIAAGGGQSNGGEPFGVTLLEDGKLMTWGSNGTGQLGTGSLIGPEECEMLKVPCAKTPVEVKGVSGKVKALAARGNNAFALLEDGQVQAWGLNSQGELATGSTMGPEPACGFEHHQVCSAKPVATKLVDIKGIGAGDYFGLAFGPAPPSVSGISPHEGRKTGAGTSVTITGSEFEEATEVKFGSVKAIRLTVNSEGSITAIAPAGKGIVDVTVTTPAGTSATSEADRFFYSRPLVKKLSPRKGSQAGGTSVTITGTNFAGATAVKFGSMSATSFKVNSATSITALSPAHAKGRVDVTVSTPNGTSAVTKKDRFRYM